MATRSIVPRADNEGGIGSAVKKWALGYFGALIIDSLRVILGAEVGKVLTCLDANGNAGWALPSGVPVGTIIAYPIETPPTGYLLCNGASLSRTTYAALFAVIGTRYGMVDVNHFTLPDYRGCFMRGWANGSTADPDRLTRTNRGDGTTGDVVGSKQLSQNFLHNHGSRQPSVTLNISYLRGGIDYESGQPMYYNYNVDAGSFYGNVFTWSSGGFSGIGSQAAHTHDDSGGSEARPLNIAVAYMIKI